MLVENHWLATSLGIHVGAAGAEKWGTESEAGSENLVPTRNGRALTMPGKGLYPDLTER